MKKLISILFLFVFSLFMVNSQPKITYVDSLKSVNISISTDTKKQLTATDNLQLQLARVVDNQTIVNKELSSGIAWLVSGVNVFTTEIEKRNKSDGQIITNKFNYTPESIKKIIRTERWLNLITWILVLMYTLYVINAKTNWKTQQVWPVLLIQCIFNYILVIFGYFFIQNILTLIFNGDYYILKELINMYT